MTKRRKKYTGDLHDRPYDLETNVFDKDKPDADYDGQDLARLAGGSELEPLAHLDLAKHGGSLEMLTGSPEIGSDANDVEDRLSEIGGKSRPAPATSQLVQDAGGYSTEIDPKMLWKSETRFYCRVCGGWIGSPKQRIECEIPSDPCRPEMVKTRGGCQGCREQHAIDLKEARGKGNPPQTCRPSVEEREAGEKESRCAKAWRNTMGKWTRAVATAEKLGNEPPPEPQPADPRWTERDLRKIQDRQDIASARAEYEEHRPPQRKPQPIGVWELDTRGTGFDARDDLRKPGWH